MNYTTVNLLKDGAMVQLQHIAELYQDDYLTAEECLKESNEILYSLLYALNDSNADCLCVVRQHIANFERYRTWVNERITNE